MSSNSRPFWMKKSPDTEPTALPIGPAVSQAEAEGMIIHADEIEVLPPEALACINAKGIAFGTASQLKSELMAAFGDAASVLREAATIKVTDVDQTAEMAKAKALRLRLKAIRCAVEKVRKEQKADSVLRGRAIDGAANAVKGVIEPAEAWLLEQEQFAERIEEQRIAALREERRQALAKYMDEAGQQSGVDLAYLSPDVWDAMLEGAKVTAQRRAETEKSEAEARRIAEEARKEKEIADEADRKRLADENERLRKEQAKKDDENKRLRDEVDKAAKDERDRLAKEDRNRLDKEASDKAEAARLAEIERKAASAPDKEKAFALIAAMRAITAPTMVTDAGCMFALAAAMDLAKLCDTLEARANKEL